MKFFTYHLTSPTGEKVEYMTGDKSASKLMAGHDIRVDWIEKQGWKVERAVSTPQDLLEAITGGQVAQFNVGDTCPLHTQVMDKLTRNGKPYHTYKGQNCSGEGWWPKRE